jgi:hypothetical protein
MQRLQNIFSGWNRKRKLTIILNVISQNDVRSILVVGASPGRDSDGVLNYIERGLLNRLPDVTFSGLYRDGGNWPRWIEADALNLPFEDKSFDLVVSNAVIEHVGFESEQIQFVREHQRVGNYWILTTPNKFFPIESHTQTIFRHFSKRWNSPLVSRLLSKHDLLRLLPVPNYFLGTRFSPTFICSNAQLKRIPKKEVAQ